MSVSTKPGAITLTVTPRLPVSTASALGSGVGGVAGVAAQGRDRADGDDTAGPGADHVAHQALGQPGEGPEIDLHRRFGPVLVHHRREHVIGLAGIVDETEIAVALACLAETCERALVGEVERQRRHRLAGMARGDLIRQRLRLLGGGAVGEIDIMAGRDERAHDRGADALGAARHENPGHAASGGAVSTRQVFWPPKPKELEITVLTFALRAVFGTTSRAMAGSAFA